MERIETALPGVLILEPRVYQDERGFFFESYHQAQFAALGIPVPFVQDNHSRSVRSTLRGLHYQIRRPQAKLCRVVQGEILDVAVDLRVGSPHFGRWVAVQLSAENKRQLFIPEGFAHGFRVLSETAEVLYKCSDFYLPEAERGIAWDDPQLAIDWGGEGEWILSPKDRRNPPLASVDPADLPRWSP
jgi:dTDP-4-dehydrorhamnose 3,5-epimerase